MARLAHLERAAPQEQVHDLLAAGEAGDVQRPRAAAIGGFDVRARRREPAAHGEVAREAGRVQGRAAASIHSRHRYAPLDEPLRRVELAREGREVERASSVLRAHARERLVAQSFGRGLGGFQAARRAAGFEEGLFEFFCLVVVRHFCALRRRGSDEGKREAQR